MKATLILVSLLMASANANASWKTIKDEFLKRGKNVAVAVTSLPAEIQAYADEEGCSKPGKVSCFYKIPGVGIVGGTFLAAGEIGNEAVLLMTAVPADLAGMIRNSFAQCAKSAKWKGIRWSCSVMEFSFNAVKRTIEAVGYYVSDNGYGAVLVAYETLDLVSDIPGDLVKGNYELAFRKSLTPIMSPMCVVARAFNNLMSAIVDGGKNHVSESCVTLVRKNVYAN